VTERSRQPSGPWCVYGTASPGHLRVRRKTEAKAWMLVLAVALNAALF
jgi:hypothetical protein